MIYSAILRFVQFLILLVNGRISIDGKDNLPEEENCILIAPHRTILDPVFIGIAFLPRQATFMAKKELFDNKFLASILRKVHAFPVDRQKPGPSALKIPVKALKEKNLSLVMFPSGTRHSNELKGGALTIAKMSNKPIVPAIYSGPLTIKGLIKLEKTTVIFGEPFTVERQLDGIEDIDQYYLEKIEESFQELEKRAHQRP